MKVTVELSLYPIAPGAVAEVVRFIDSITVDQRVEVVVNQMSTQLRGELHDVMALLTVAMQKSFTAGHTQALVAKFLNVDLPIAEAPDLAAHR